MAARRKKTRKTSPRTPGGVQVSKAHAAWLDGVAASIRMAGGPRLTRAQVLQALLDAATARKLDPAKVKSLQDLRVAFGALDLTTIERLLKERPKLETGLLKALEESIK